MKINPLDSYEEAKYPSVRDARTKKMSSATKSGAALLLASITAMAISSCDPKTGSSGREKPTNGEGATSARSFRGFGAGSNEPTESTEDYEFPTLAGDVMITETGPNTTESFEDPVLAGIMIAPTSVEDKEDPVLAGEIMIMD